MRLIELAKKIWLPIILMMFSALACMPLAKIESIRPGWGSGANYPSAVAVHDPFLVADGFHIDWQLEPVYTRQLGHPVMVSSKNYLHLLGSLDSKDPLTSIALDPANGNLVWTSQFEAIRVLGAGQEAVYQGGIGELIRAHAMNGEVTWRIPLRGARSVTEIIVLHDEIHVNAVQNEYFFVDAASGEILEAWDYRPFTRIYFAYNGVLIGLSPDATTVIGLDSTSRQQLWSTALQEQVEMGPAVTDGQVIFRGGGTQGAVIAVDIATGSALWKSADSDFVSNVAAGSHSAYSLKASGEVVQFDLPTGTASTIIDFTQGELTTRDENLMPRPFRIAVSQDDRRLFVLLGDSWQLFSIQLY